MSKENEEIHAESVEEEPMTQNEILDGCVGWYFLVCLPFVVVIKTFLVKSF